MTRPTGRSPGRPPKPTGLKLLEGNPGKRTIVASARGVPVPGVPPVPRSLRAAGRAAWETYWTAGRAWLAASDIPIVTQLCELHDDSAALRSRIKSEGMLVRSDTTNRTFLHAAYNDLRGMRAEMRALWSMTYMDPSDRARLTIEGTQPDTAAERFLG